MSTTAVTFGNPLTVPESAEYLRGTLASVQGATDRVVLAFATGVWGPLCTLWWVARLPLTLRACGGEPGSGRVGNAPSALPCSAGMSRAWDAH